MRKSELRKLRALPATKEMIKKAKEPNCSYKVFARVQNLNGYIKIAVFFPDDMRKDIKTPRYEVFLDVKAETYITRVLDESGREKQWSTAMIDNLGWMGYLYWYTDNKEQIWLNKDAMYTLNHLKLECNCDYKGFQRLRKWQQEQRAKNIKKAEEREQAPWDADMKLIPKVPKGFKEWMRRYAVRECYIIYEYDVKGQKIGYCSKCKKYVPISSPRHNATTQCPACKSKGTFKASSRIKTLETGYYAAEIIQKIKGGIVIRRFTQHQWYRDKNYTEPGIHTHENMRVLIFENGTVKKYEWDNYKNKFHRWIPLERTGYSGYYAYSQITKLYQRNLRHLKQHSMLKESALELWPELPLSTIRYLEAEYGNPAIEKLARIGMFRLARDLIKASYDVKLLDQDATEISKILKLDKSRLKRLREMDGNVYSLRWLQYEKFANTIWPDEMIQDFGEANIGTADFGFLHIPISFVKCHNYLKKQATIMGESMQQTLTTWRDYVNMADQMKMNTKCDQIAKPKDLRAAHDELVLLKTSKELEKQAKQIEKKWPKVNKQLQKLQKFAYTLGEYTIVVPKNVLDIVTEGTILKHCVHTCDYYFSRIQTDESYLFFLRKTKSPDMPWYTLEVEPSGNIRQKRTTGDNQNEDFQKAVSFLKKWQQFFQKQLTEEEAKLGEKANKLREENYTNLRKKGNRVWHGRLAGKLLADVLEQDFMAAGM